ncbi:MAG: radical SAM family heme chaperone HemW [Anaerolineaceae bacterium]|nr:radical SAM family heme chaperone HemW [Anaerolineaceae bacterium]
MVNTIIAANGTPQSLYVHVPFCKRKCGYCDFYSVEPRSDQLLSDYLEALELEAAGIPHLTLRTVYIGGGTPALLSSQQLERLLRLLRSRFDLTTVDEFTVEANPGAIDRQKADVLTCGGVNRVSLGVQSLQPATLETLGRTHGPDSVYEAIETLRGRQLRNLSLDLIFGVPGQSPADWRKDLAALTALEPEHISVYGLAISPRTPLGRRVACGELQPISDEFYVEMLEEARRFLGAAGYEHYEISNFARAGFRCRHNMVYWRNQPYIGLGAAAASYVAGRRWINVSDVEEYIKRLQRGESPVETAEQLAPQQRARETAVLGLRMIDGLDIEDFHRTTGFAPLELFAEAIETHSRAGMLEMIDGHLRLTPRALAVSDSVMTDFV